ncbi:MAG TPA: DUF445 family protein [Longimicrobiaceae bacterium]|nr:DUF445 family protein [Longimicrobiaceae bacterium]
MEILGLTVVQWILPILIGVTAGLLTNAIAIWMLFHPYEPVRLGRIRVMPMGAIPKEIDRIAKRIGETVGRELLTPEDIGRTLSSESFRARFDEALRDALHTLLEREIGPPRDLVSPEQAVGLEKALQRLLDKILEGVEVYLRSPEWEDRVRGFARALGGEFRERPFSVVLTPELQLDLNRGVQQLWAGVRESPEFARVIADALDRGIERMFVSEKPLRSYVPAGAVNLGESFVANYLPILLERLGGLLDDPATRLRLQETLRRFTDRFLEEQKTWKRVVGRLMITERTLAQTVEAIEQGGVEEISALLREPEVQVRVAEAVNHAVEELLDKPVRELLGDVSPERADRLRNALVERVLYLFRHPTTEDVVLTRLQQLVAATADKRVGDLLNLLGEERSRDLTDHAADWVVETLRGPRVLAFLRAAIENRTAWMLSVPVGRPADYLPDDTVRRAEILLFDPLWAFLQRRVPTAVTGLPVAQMVENKLRSYPISKVEDLIWRVSRRELVLIIYLGGFLGALIGSVMLLLQSIPAGIAASAFFILVSFLFLNLKG